MQVAHAQLNTHLQSQASKGLRSLYTLHGDEALLQQEALDAIRTLARAQGYTERSVFTVAGAHFDWGEVLAAGGAMSLFADKQIIEIRIPSGKPGKEGSVALQQVAEMAAGNDSTLTLVVLPRLDKASKSTAWFAALENNGVSIQVDPVERQALPAWIAHRLKAQEQRVQEGEAGQHTLQFFAERVEGNLLAAHQEIQKLGLLYPAGAIKGEDVRAAVLNVSRFDAVQLGEAVLTGDIDRTVRILECLKDEGAQAVAVMNPLIWAITPLVKVKQAESRGENLNSAMKSAKLFYEKEAFARRVLPRLSLKQLQAALLKLADIDKIGKGMMQGDAWLEITRLCFGLAKIAARPKSR